MDLKIIAEEIIDIVTNIIDVWDGKEVICCIPILSCTKLSYQAVFIDGNSIKLAPTCKINLFKRGYKGYNHIFKTLTGNKPLSKKEVKECHRRTMVIIRDILTTGFFGKAVVSTKVNEVIFKYAYKPFVDWNAEGVVTIFHPMFKGKEEEKDTNIMDFLG